VSERLMRRLAVALFAALTVGTALPATDLLAATPEPAASGFVPVEPRLPAAAARSADGDMAAETASPGTTPQPSPQDPVTRALDRVERDLERARAETQILTESNQRLSELNAELRQELESLAVELQSVRVSGERRAWLYGGGLVIAGLLIGRLLAARRRSSAWS
jgi:hypothetical protein